MSAETDKLTEDINKVTQKHAGCSCKSLTLYFEDNNTDEWDGMGDVEFTVNNDGTGVLKFTCGSIYKFKLVE